MPTLGNVLPGFTDWFKSTGPAIFSSPDKILNELTLVNYSMRFWLDNDMKKVLQGGTFIQDSIYLQGDYSFGSYFPGQVETFNATNTLSVHQAPWRFERGKMSWTEAEIDLQGPSVFNADSRFQVFKRIRAQKKENMMTGVSNGIEARIWATPDYNQMELATAQAPDAKHYSVPVFINEWEVAKHGSTAAGMYPGWATVQQLSPVTNPGWTNQKFGYESAGKVKTTDGSAPNDLNRSLSRARRQTRAAALPRGGGPDQAFTAPSMICCSDYGIWLYEQNLEAGNERFRTRAANDGQYDAVQFDGIPLEYCVSLDGAVLYPSTEDGAAVPTNEAAAAEVVPLYFLINRPFLKMFFHADHFFKMKDPYFLPEQPDVWVSLLDIWSNFFCLSRRRHAIVVPTADQIAQTG